MPAEKILQNSCDKDNDKKWLENGTGADKRKEKTALKDIELVDKGFKVEKYDDSTIQTITSPAIAECSSSVASKNVDNRDDKSNMFTQCCTHLKRTAIWVERIFLVSICIGVALGFIVPIIIYAVDSDRGDNSTLSIDFDVDNCPAVNMQVRLCKY